MVAFAGGRIAEMSRWASLAEAAVDRPGVSVELVSSTRALLGLTKWSAAYSDGEVTLSLKIAQETNRQRHIPAPWRAGTHTVLGWSLYRSGQFRAAQEMLSNAIVLADEDGDVLNAMISYGIQSIIAAANGLPHEAERLASQSESVSANNALGQHFDRWGASFARGWLALTQQENARGRQHIEHALEYVRRGPRSLEVAEMLTALSMAEESLGDAAASAQHLIEAQRILANCPDPGYLLADPRKGSPKLQEPKAAEQYPGWASLT
jgi:tetratricopeptide (TPR) repeat protein